MKKLEIFNKASRTFHRAGFQVQKHSPEILLVAGVAGMITSTVLACKATTKAGDVLANAKKKIDEVHEVMADESIPESEYSDKDSKRDLTIIYAQTGVNMLKLYGPAIIVGALSVTSIFASSNILRKRNIALAAAYATVDSSFKDYRNRVVERFGKELDKELRYNIKAKEVEEIVVDDEGNETVVKKTVKTATINHESDYARFFDEFCNGWERDAEYNLMFLRRQQDHANELLQKKGHLFLNEVYDMLGIKRTATGQSVGWIYDEKHPVGDNFVDFGIYNLYDEQKRAFVNGYEKSILLDFNVDGNILDLIG